MAIKIKNKIKTLMFTILFRGKTIDDKIMIESALEIKDNSKPIFEYLLKYTDNKYRIIWLVENVEKYRKQYAEYENVVFVEKKRNKYPSLRYFYHSLTSKYCFYTHSHLGCENNKKQKRIFLTHATPLKNSSGHFWDVKYNTDIITTSEYSAILRCKTFLGGGDRVRILGFPRNDALYFPEEVTRNYYGDLGQKKLIIWMPTFKRYRSGIRNDYEGPQKSDITILSDDFIVKLNKILEEREIKLLIKYHPGQDMNYVKKIQLSNIETCTNIDLEDKGLDLYSLLGLSDALITDFSSVAFDYLLVDKPIAYEIGDIESYDKGIGFVVENPLELMAGSSLKSEHDFLKFVEDVSNGVDEYKEKRRLLRNKIHKYKDGNSSKRVLEYFGLLGDKNEEV